MEFICNVWPTEPWDVCEASEDKDSLDDPKGHAWAECKACWRMKYKGGFTKSQRRKGSMRHAPMPHLRLAREGSR